MRSYFFLAGLSLTPLLLLDAGSCRAEFVPPGSQPRPGSSVSVVDLQQFRTVQSVQAKGPNNQTAELKLINLNPHINRWYILQIHRPGTGERGEYHLDNPYPEQQRLMLVQDAPDALVVLDNQETFRCPSLQFLGGGELESARKSGHQNAPLCGGRFYLRNQAKGHRTAIESVTDFLRDNLPGGETVVGFVKDTFFQDAYLENVRTTTTATARPSVAADTYPAAATVNPEYTSQLIVPAELGIQVAEATPGMLTGTWYRVVNHPGIFVSLMQPKAIAKDILTSYRERTNSLDSVEQRALSYLIAFDLRRFKLGFAVGTEHPRVGWSERPPEQVRVSAWPGPDRIGSIAPLVANGLLNPVEATRTVATFTGGFKRSHGAFKYGEFAHRNHGSHYGFLESGVILSSLNPGLATLFVLKDGTVKMKTWTDEDDGQLAEIVYARQNGVPLIEWHPNLEKPIPGGLVTRWGKGNWSGSSDQKLRTLRAGIALQQTVDNQFLIYGYFSTATPSAMVRVFQAYNCRYAMHLDMNALEHTYLALYHRDLEGKHLRVQHLLKDMSVLDKTEKDTYIPRFLGYSDNRDFFFVMQRE